MDLHVHVKDQFALLLPGMVTAGLTDQSDWFQFSIGLSFRGLTNCPIILTSYMYDFYIRQGLSFLGLSFLGLQTAQ